VIIPCVRRTLALVAALALVAVGSAVAGVQLDNPRSLTGPVTVRCDPPLVTEVGVLSPRQFMVARMEFAPRLGGVLTWTNNSTYYSFVGSRTASFDRKLCDQVKLPKGLPPARLVRLAKAELTCVVPGRRLLVHAQRHRSTALLSVRAMPHGQLLAHFRVSKNGTAAFASRYAVTNCDLNP
jgi:hypothetical protein